MSVPNSTSRVSYTLTSTTQTLSVPFYFLATTDLQVIKQGTTPVTLAITTNYTVSGAGVEAGGSITLTGTGVSVSDVITIKRNMALTQPIDLVLNDRFPSPTVERMSDRSTMQIQQVSEIASRSLRFEDGETTDGTLVKTARSSKVLSFDENGDISFITPEGVLYTPGDSLAADSIASLKAISVSGITSNQAVSVLGYYVAGDGGGGIFYYDSASATADNGGTVIQPTTGTGRWKRVYSGALNVRWFGAKGDGTTDDSASFQNTLSASQVVCVPSGTYKINQVQITAKTQIDGVGGPLITNTTSGWTMYFEVNDSADRDGPGWIRGLSFSVLNGIRFGRIGPVSLIDATWDSTTPAIKCFSITDCQFDCNRAAAIPDAGTNTPVPSTETLLAYGCAIACSKFYNSTIERNRITGFGVGIHQEGSSICAIRTNRTVNCGRDAQCLGVQLGGRLYSLRITTVLGTYVMVVL